MKILKYGTWLFIEFRTDSASIGEEKKQCVWYDEKKNKWFLTRPSDYLHEQLAGKEVDEYYIPDNVLAAVINNLIAEGKLTNVKET